MVDTEGDFYYNLPSPHFDRFELFKWSLNKIAGKIFRYPWPSRKGVLNLIDSFKKYKFPATFCISGHLYLKSCKGAIDHSQILPNNNWLYHKIKKDWYYWDNGGNFNDSPGIYFGDIIEKEKNNPLFKFGLHGFAHEALTLEPKETISAIIKSGIAAANKIGVNITSFASPFELIEDESDPNKIFDVLKENKIKRVFYSGTDIGLIKKRHFDIRKPIIKNGLEKIWISNYFEGTSSKNHIKKIINEIYRNRNKDAVYCLVTHDFTHKNQKNINLILSAIKKIQNID